jgi:hypothetical protein
MIREAILFGGALYALIIIAQITARPSIWPEVVVVALVLAVGTACYLTDDEKRLHVSEIVALWAAVLLFLAYAMVKYGGVL